MTARTFRLYDPMPRKIGWTGFCWVLFCDLAFTTYVLPLLTGLGLASG